MAIGRRRGLAWLLSVFVCFAGTSSTAHAAASLIPTTDSPFIWIALDRGSVTIRTWSQPAVSLVADPSVDVEHAPPRVAERVPQQIPLWSASIEGPSGPLNLAPELFPLPPFPPGEHDALVLRGTGNATLLVPSQTALVVANVRNGSVIVQGYAGTALVAHVTSGQVRMSGDSTTAAVQIDAGPVIIRNSAFTRLRLRAGSGNVYMNDCRADQIQVTSLTGSIVYDDGVFEPGLAHFESTWGNIAIGVDGPTQIDAQSGVGRVYYRIAPDAGSIDRTQSEVQAMILGGGPVVTASSLNGAVLFYRGALRYYPALQRAFMMQLPSYSRIYGRPYQPPR